MLARDREAWLATVDPASTDFADNQGAVFDNLAQVPLEVWRYEFAGEGPGLAADRHTSNGTCARLSNTAPWRSAKSVDAGSTVASHASRSRASIARPRSASSSSSAWTRRTEASIVGVGVAEGVADVDGAASGPPSSPSAKPAASSPTTRSPTTTSSQAWPRPRCVGGAARAQPARAAPPPWDPS